MKFSVAALLMAVAPLAMADKTSLDVKSVISAFYSTTPTIPAGASTTLASALHSVETKWVDSPAFTSARAAIYSAAPSSLQASLATSGWDYGDVVTASWFTKNAPKSVQKDVQSYNSAVYSIEDSVFSKVATETSKGGVPARQTGAVAAGVIGVVAAVGMVL
ncbi:hypothetical protein CJF31_00006070 [Rutstroemia sp. NJR-2017a BVV2]|nr:hypothetical protein CJF31_00010196 [Rutstroemia sp. NJR-2017a BVV2]PQE25193.1 hypothetical protein CJF31_00006070 [Rutstroemia sp. NJR-2017a BVV2]